MVSHLANTSIWATSGVVRVSTLDSIPLIRPISVAAPVRDHHALALAAGDQGAAESHARPIAECSIARNRFDVLFHRQGLARENGLLNLQAVGLQQAELRGNFVACLQEHDVPGNQLLTVDSAALAAAQNRSARSQHPADGLHRFFGLAFLNETNDCVGNYYGKNHQRICHVIQQRRDDGGSEQHVNQDVVELQQEAGQGAAPRRFGKAVRSLAHEPRLRLTFAKTLGRRCQRYQRSFRRTVMPRPFSVLR